MRRLSAALPLGRLARAGFFTLTLVVAYFTLCSIDDRPMTGLTMAERFTAFMLMGASLQVGYPGRPLVRALTVTALAMGLEFAQGFVSGRHGRWFDAVEKSAGGLTGVALGLVALWLLRPARAQG